MMTLAAYGKTDVGLLRSNNEDNFYQDEQRGLFIVADGMGGHAAGEVASQMAIDAVAEKLSSGPEKNVSAQRLQALLAEAVHHANRSISQAAADNSAWSGMGTTLTILLLHAGQALLTHVGDSRLYRWNNQQLEQLSDDQTLINDQLRRGIINEQEARQSTLRNILLQAVGVSEELELCQKTFTIQPGDCFLLCSDGLTGMLSDEEINGIMTNNPLPEQGCETLMAEALAAGGKDNITALIVTIDDNAKS